MSVCYISFYSKNGKRAKLLKSTYNALDLASTPPSDIIMSDLEARVARMEAMMDRVEPKMDKVMELISVMKKPGSVHDCKDDNHRPKHKTSSSELESLSTFVRLVRTPFERKHPHEAALARQLQENIIVQKTEYLSWEHFIQYSNTCCLESGVLIICKDFPLAHIRDYRTRPDGSQLLYLSHNKAAFEKYIPGIDGYMRSPVDAIYVDTFLVNSPDFLEVCARHIQHHHQSRPSLKLYELILDDCT